MKISLSLIVLVLGLALSSITCKEEPTQPQPLSPDPTIQLSVEDASCTEVWLKLSAANASNPIIVLKRDSTILDTLTLIAADTTIIDENLLPSHTYTYTAQLLNSSNTPYSSTPIQVRTMDTTSHDFSWQTFSLGDNTNSSGLHDVAIVNDTLAYAVGEIYRNDTLFNIAKWNGQTWEMKRTPFLGPCSAVLFPALKTIWAFSNNTLLVSNGGSIVRLDEVNAVMDCRMNSLLYGAINKIYTNSSYDIYAVGNAGSIVHYDGNSWQMMTSGTDIDLKDVYGSPDGKTVWACGYTYDNSKSVLLRYNNDSWQTLWNRNISQVEPFGYFATSIWCLDRFVFLSTGRDVFRLDAKNPMESAKKIFTMPSFPYRLRGNAINDLIVGGDYSRIWHYNGVSWKQLTDGSSTRTIYSLAEKSSLIIAVGSENSSILSRGLIMMGRR